MNVYCDVFVLSRMPPPPASSATTMVTGCSALHPLPCGDVAALLTVTWQVTVTGMPRLLWTNPLL